MSKVKEGAEKAKEELEKAKKEFEDRMGDDVSDKGKQSKLYLLILQVFTTSFLTKPLQVKSSIAERNRSFQLF